MPDPIVVITGGPIGGPDPGGAGKSILGVIKDACKVIGVQVPDAVFSSTDREHVELQMIANEMAQRIAYDSNYDWRELTVPATIVGDGTTTNFSLPEDYRQMLASANMWGSGGRPLMFEPDIDRWMASPPPLTPGAWTIVGETITILPVLAADSTVNFAYMSRDIATDDLGNVKQLFDDDTDRFRLNNRLLRLGIIYHWKELKGFPYAEDMATFEEARDQLVTTNRGPRVMTSGRGSFRRPVGVAWPWQLG